MTINEFLNKLDDRLNKLEIKRAYEYAFEKHIGMERLTGDEFITHPLAVASILLDFNVDTETIIIALLHEVLISPDGTLSDLEKNFGEDIAKSVESLTKINRLELTDDTEASAQNMRKILVGMAEDVRVIYVKLADRLHNMRTNDAIHPDKQKMKAKDTMAIMVPIAHRLGMNSIKSEMENLCLRYLKPDVYSDILEKLNASATELNNDIETMKSNISSILDENGIKHEIKGRVKSVYSIYNKLSTGRKWDDIYDILALRIFVEKESECYTVVGLIHSKYRPIAKRFKDFIASPKSNMYQSLHTGVLGEGGKLFEVQIRTYEMDEIAEKGIASHWSYKEKGSNKVHSIMEQKLEMFRNIIETNNEASDSDFEKVIETDFFKESIYVYTPKGDVVELPNAATPIDFAYRIHSNVGDTMVGAIVNDLIVSFDCELSDGDVIKIKTSASSKPNKEWLNIAKTTQAKNKIKSYFSKKLRSDYIKRGKELLEKELRKRKLSFDEVLSDENITKILKDLKFNELDELLLALGSLRYTAGYIINLATTDKALVKDILIDKDRRKHIIKTSYKSDIIVDGQSNILASLANCCKPVKGDDVVGYITKGSGIIVHKKTCDNIDLENSRTIDVTWNMDSTSEFLSKVLITSSSDNNILQELIEMAMKKNMKIVAFNTISSSELSTVFEVSVKVKDTTELESFINGVMRIKNVKEASKK